jgi:hypothetical protein
MFMQILWDLWHKIPHPNLLWGEAASKRLMRSIAGNAVGAVAATAKINGFIIFRLVFLRPEIRTFMLSIAKRPGFRFPAGTVPVAFSRLDRHRIRGFLSYYWSFVSHDFFP